MSDYDVLAVAAAVAGERSVHIAVVEDLLAWPATESPLGESSGAADLMRARAELVFSRRLVYVSARVVDGCESPDYFAGFGEAAGERVRSCVVGLLDHLSSAYACFARDRCMGRPPPSGLVPSPPQGPVEHVTVSSTLGTWAVSRLATVYAAELRRAAFLDAAAAVGDDGRDVLLLAASLGEASGAAIEVHWRELQAVNRQRRAAL